MYNTITNIFQSKQSDKSRRKLGRQTSIEEDALFIRKTIAEIERSSNRFKNEKEPGEEQTYVFELSNNDEERVDRDIPSTSKNAYRRNSKQADNFNETRDRDGDDETKDDSKRKDGDKTNGKKKSKSRARLEREQSKPSESDTEPEVDTVTVEIPRRRKRPRRPSERPRTPPTSVHSDSGEEVSK